jgi:hypothetical protein
MDITKSPTVRVDTNDEKKAASPVNEVLMSIPVNNSPLSSVLASSIIDIIGRVRIVQSQIPSNIFLSIADQILLGKVLDMICVILHIVKNALYNPAARHMGSQRRNLEMIANWPIGNSENPVEKPAEKPVELSELSADRYTTIFNEFKDFLLRSGINVNHLSHNDIAIMINVIYNTSKTRLEERHQLLQNMSPLKIMLNSNVVPITPVAPAAIASTSTHQSTQQIQNQQPQQNSSRINLSSQQVSRQAGIAAMQQFAQSPRNLPRTGIFFNKRLSDQYPVQSVDSVSNSANTADAVSTNKNSTIVVAAKIGNSITADDVTQSALKKQKTNTGVINNEKDNDKK